MRKGERMRKRENERDNAKAKRKEKKLERERRGRGRVSKTKKPRGQLVYSVRKKDETHTLTQTLSHSQVLVQETHSCWRI